MDYGDTLYTMTQLRRAVLSDRLKLLLQLCCEFRTQRALATRKSGDLDANFTIKWHEDCDGEVSVFSFF